jgi:hypothetical protein
MDSNQNQISDNLAIEKERQKTKRYLIFIGAFAVISIVGIFLVLNKAGAGGTGLIDLDLSKGKISLQLQKPILEQTSQPTAEYKTDNGKVEFTTGKIDNNIITELKNENVPISVNSFTGENYINTELGFILTILNPEAWTVTYNPEGKFNPYYSVNTIVTNDAVQSHFNVNVDRLPPDADFRTSILLQLQELVNTGVIMDLPAISYDEESETIFLSYYNDLTQGATYQKIILDGYDYYVATANFNSALTPPERVNDLIEMVASFTLISY